MSSRLREPTLVNVRFLSRPGRPGREARGLFVLPFLFWLLELEARFREAVWPTKRPKVNEKAEGSRSGEKGTKTGRTAHWQSDRVTHTRKDAEERKKKDD